MCEYVGERGMRQGGRGGGGRKGGRGRKNISTKTNLELESIFSKRKTGFGQLGIWAKMPETGEIRENEI